MNNFPKKSYLCTQERQAIVTMANENKARKWLSIVEEDLSVAELLFNNGHWLYTTYMCHQAIEKTLKAYWCVCRDDAPPFIHDHGRIAKGCGLYTQMSEAQKDFLATIREMNIEARYQEFKDNIARQLNHEITAEILKTTKQMHVWILQKLQEKSSTR